MAIIATAQNIQSNILSYETLNEYGFCRKFVKTLDNTASDLELGSVVFTIDAGASYQPVDDAEVASPVADAVAIVIGFGDRGEALVAEGTTATEEGILLIQGIAIVRKQYLKLATGSTTPKDAIQEYVEAQMVLVNVDESFVEFDGTYNDVTPIT